MLTSTETLSHILKRETLSQHKAVEQALPLFRREFSKVDYAQMIQRSFSFFKNYEEQMQQWKHLDVPFLEERLKRVEWLENDLKFLGSATNPKDLYSPLEISTKPAALGAMYVIEGSTLGGQLIVRHLKTQLDLPEAALHFYNGYKERTGEFWLKFKNYLDNSSEASEEFITSAVASARITFEIYEKYLSRP